MKQRNTQYEEVYGDDAVPYKNHPFDIEGELPR
jgi:hypothetical protein